MFTGNSYEKTSATADKNSNPRDEPEGIWIWHPQMNITSISDSCFVFQFF